MAKLDCLMGHDNAPAHSPLSVQQFFAVRNVNALPHSTYWPHLAPCYCVFPRIKPRLQARLVQNVREMQALSLTVVHWFEQSVLHVLPAVAKTLDSLPKLGKAQRPITKKGKRTLRYRHTPFGYALPRTGFGAHLTIRALSSPQVEMRSSR